MKERKRNRIDSDENREGVKNPANNVTLHPANDLYGPVVSQKKSKIL